MASMKGERKKRERREERERERERERELTQRSREQNRQEQSRRSRESKEQYEARLLRKIGYIIIIAVSGESAEVILAKQQTKLRRNSRSKQT